MSFHFRKHSGKITLLTYNNYFHFLAFHFLVYILSIYNVSTLYNILLKQLHKNAAEV
jgi:hypothetical protein